MPSDVLSYYASGSTNGGLHPGRWWELCYRVCTCLVSASLMLAGATATHFLAVTVSRCDIRGRRCAKPWCSSDLGFSGLGFSLKPQTLPVSRTPQRCICNSGRHVEHCGASSLSHVSNTAGHSCHTHAHPTTPALSHHSSHPCTPLRVVQSSGE